MTGHGSAILVVDDNDDNRYALCRRLAQEGYDRVETAENGRIALESLAARPFDLVLLDIQMPEIDGYEVLARMKGDDVHRHIPVIIISAVSELDNVARCIELGADDFLPKPFNRVILRARVRACLERKRLHDREAANLAEIDLQRMRADRLLQAILPASAIAELTETDRVTPRRYDDVAVLFADIVGFTAYCDAHPPEAVVENLQLLVEAFEEKSARHGMEKIKTVGDALMATANLLEPHDDPVMAAVRLGSDLIDAAERNPARWSLRVAIHFGAVVAGIVGRSKFSFDLWGDTVNTAARLASFGDPAIHLSDTAWARIADRCQARPLGPVEVKGKRPIEVYRYKAD